MIKKLKIKCLKTLLTYYGKNIIKESTLINGVKEFLKWCKEKEYFNGSLHKQTRALSNRSFKENWNL